MARFTPQPGPQRRFLASPADICIYGGGAGGGKTFALLMDPLRRREIPHFGAVLFRRTVPQIRNQGGLWDSAQKLYPGLGGFAVQHTLEWRWDGGFRVTMRHLEREQEIENWQGSQIPWIGFDELTHFTENQFVYMLSRSRSTHGVPGRVRATTNADASSWVRKFIEWWINEKTGFAIPERAGVIRWQGMAGEERIWANTREKIEAKLGPNSAMSVTFIPAKLSDNPALMKSDPTYLNKLRSLNRVDRQRLELANWNIAKQGGTLFLRQWFSLENASAKPLGKVIRYWDLAASRPTPEYPDPDWTRGTKAFLDDQRRLWIPNVVSIRDTPASVESLFEKTALQDGPEVEQWIEHDPGQAGKSQASAWVRRFNKLNVHFTAVPHAAKLARAERVSPMCETGNVILVRAPWNEDWLNEVTGFPNVDHDEFVDTLSGAHSILVGNGTFDLKQWGETDESNQAMESWDDRSVLS